MLTLGTASADEILAKSKGCFTCHSMDTKGFPSPTFKEIARKYRGTKDIIPKMVKRIMFGGGKPVWIPGVVKPGNPQVTEQEATVLAKWILGL